MDCLASSDPGRAPLAFLSSVAYASLDSHFTKKKKNTLLVKCAVSNQNRETVCEIAMRSRSDPQSGNMADVELLDSVAKSVEESKKQVETLINRTEEEDALRRLLDVHTDLDSGLQQYKERRSALKGSGGAEAQGPREVLAAGSDGQASASNHALLAGTCQALVLPSTLF